MLRWQSVSLAMTCSTSSGVGVLRCIGSIPTSLFSLLPHFDVLDTYVRCQNKSNMEDFKYWIVVASKEHVKEGVQAGFMQACHGKASRLKRLQEKDWVIYYSPKKYLLVKKNVKLSA
jgi:EVE domain